MAKLEILGTGDLGFKCQGCWSMEEALPVLKVVASRTTGKLALNRRFPCSSPYFINHERLSSFLEKQF